MADSYNISIMFESSTQTVRIQSPTLPVRFFYAAGPGRRLSIRKGSSTQDWGAVDSCFLNRYILSDGNNNFYVKHHRKILIYLEGAI